MAEKTKQTKADKVKALRHKAVELQTEIQSVDGFTEDTNLLYAHREAGNLVAWLSK